MDLKSFPVESDKIFLSDVSKEFADLEGEVPIDERVWVVIRQASQADNMRRADMYTKRETKYTAGQDGLIDSFSRVYTENILRRHMEEVRLTLKDVGNLTLEGKSLFPKMPAKNIPQKEFEDIWGNLPDTRIADAIHLAVLQVNPDWSNPGE